MLLALDTSTSITSVALAAPDGAIVAHESVLPTVGHCVELTTLIDALLQRANVSWPAVQAVAVAIGPGAFTGIRVGMAAAKGIAQARGIPLIGVPTPAMLAHAARAQWTPEMTHIVPVIDARRSEYYWCTIPRANWADWTTCYDAAHWDAQVRVTPLADCQQAMNDVRAASGQCGIAGAEALRALDWNEAPFYAVTTDATTVAALAVPRWQAGAFDNLLTLVPLYVRPSYAG